MESAGHAAQPGQAAGTERTARTDQGTRAGQPTRTDQATRSPRHWIILGVLCLGTFAVLLDSTIVNVALPSMITSLHASLDQALWIVNGYLLVFATLLILASRLGDMFGPRRLFTIGLAVFALSSALCGAAQNPGELIAARVLQGIGAAAMTPQAMVIIQAVFPRERMGAAFGVFSSMVGLAAVSGPVLGGILTTDVGWRWIFYVNLPIAAVGIAASYLLVPDVRTGRRHLLDLPGVLLGSVGLAVLLYGVIEGQRYSWGEIARGVTIPEVIAAGVVLLAAFCWWEQRHAQPLLPGALLKNRTFTIMVLLNLATQFALQSMLLVNSINLQSVLGFTAVHAGLTGLPLTLSLTAVAPFAGRLTDRFGGKFVLAAGLTIYAAGIAGVAVLSSDHATSWTFAPALLVAGIGMGAIFAPVATTGMRAAPPELAGAASGALNTGRQLGGTIGGAVTGAVLATRLTSALQTRAVAAAASLPRSARHPFVAGFERAASAGLQVGRGQAAVKLPHGIPAPLLARLEFLAHDVFVQGFLQAMRPTLVISVVLLLAGAVTCLLLRSRPASAQAIAGAGPTQEPAKAHEPAGAHEPAETSLPGRAAESAP